jgi:hypothetical protein
MPPVARWGVRVLIAAGGAAAVLLSPLRAPTALPVCATHRSHISQLRDMYGARPVAMPPAFAANTSGFMSSDSRNFAVQVAPTELARSRLLGSGWGTDPELVVVANYNPPRANEWPGTTPAADLIVYVVGANSGETHEVAAFWPGCHD